MNGTDRFPLLRPFLAWSYGEGSMALFKGDCHDRSTTSPGVIVLRRISCDNRSLSLSLSWIFFVRVQLEWSVKFYERFKIDFMSSGGSGIICVTRRAC